MIAAPVQLAEPVLRQVEAVPAVRPEAVARGRALLGTAAWCRAEEVADQLVDCYLSRRIP